METKETSAKNTHSKAEKVKKNMSGHAEKSKDTIREMITSNSKLLEDAMTEHSKFFNSVKSKFNDSVASSDIKQTLVKSVKLAEDTFDAIINSYTRQMELI